MVVSASVVFVTLLAATLVSLAALLRMSRALSDRDQALEDERERSSQLLQVANFSGKQLGGVDVLLAGDAELGTHTHRCIGVLAAEHDDVIRFAHATTHAVAPDVERRDPFRPRVHREAAGTRVLRELAEPEARAHTRLTDRAGARPMKESR